MFSSFAAQASSCRIKTASSSANVQACLPVNVPGAMFHIGDGHAAQGDGEVCGVATEIPTRGTFTFELIKANLIGTPRIESDEFLMAVGSARPMEDAARIAFYELILWLEQDFGI